MSFDAVGLSGPRDDGTLFTPARLHVLRYLTGSGPRVVSIDNGLERQGPYIMERGGGFKAAAGGFYRVYPFLWGGRSHIRRREVVDSGVCNGTGSIRQPRSVRPAQGTARTVHSPAGARWRGRLLRGPFGLRCVESARADRESATRRECERMSGRSSAVFGIRVAGSGGRASTLVMAQAPTLRTLTVEAAGSQARTIPAPRGSRITLAAYDGVVAPETVRLTLRFAGGGQRRVWLKDR